MPRSPTPNTPSHSSGAQQHIRQVSGTLYMLAIIASDGDAAPLFTDLKRSRISDYKLQRYASIDKAINMIQACALDLVFINVEDFEDLSGALSRVRRAGFDGPIIGLASKRSLERIVFENPSHIDRFICKEDASPSLVEQVVSSTIEREALQSQIERMVISKELAMNVGKLGSWTYFVNEGLMELDTVARAMLGLDTDAALIPLSELLEFVYSEDRKLLESSLDQQLMDGHNTQCSFRMQGDQMPLPQFDIKGIRISRRTTESPRLTGVIRQASEFSELFDRVAEANEALQEAFQARDEAMYRANQTLRALADEIGAPQPAEIVTEEPDEAPKVETEHTSEQAPAPSTPAKKSRSRSRKAKDVGATTDSLEIDKTSAFKNVVSSLANKPRPTEQAQQQAFPFDFSQELSDDFSPPNPAREGFTGAANRLISLTQRVHNIDISISIEDEDTIEMEREKDLVFEILKELVTNVVKHANASMCIVSIFRDEDDWVLQVEDDGIGLDEKLKSVSAPLNKIGLFRIRTQLALKNGQLDMTPARPTGLIARVRLPVCIRENLRR